MPHLTALGRPSLASVLICIALTLAACGGDDKSATPASTNASSCKISHCAPAP
ncbi:hypothetical protein [Caballeronia sp. HLA56]